MTIIIQNDVNLHNYNTMGIAVTAKYFVAVNSIAILEIALTKRELFEEAVLILGGGSNILLTKNFTGLVLRNELKGIKVIKENADHVWIQAAAGENWHTFVMYCVSKNFGGIENLALIPGTVGAAPVQNIGAYGVELKDTVESLEAYELATGKLTIFNKEECEFAYRESVFKTKLNNKYIITQVTLKLTKLPYLNFSYGLLAETLQHMNFSLLSVAAVSDAVIQIRQSKLPDPAIIPNTGSFFKNPYVSLLQFNALKLQFPNIPNYPIDANTVKIPAGWLIEQCGWKGKRIGNVGVYEKQALVLVNHNQGGAEEILNLVIAIQQSVKNKFNILLEPEVQII